MRDAAIFGYVSETRATAEYWFDRDGENLPKEYPHRNVESYSMPAVHMRHIFRRSGVIHGIQWMPLGPYLSYLVEDYDFAKREFENMWTEEMQKKKKEIDEWGSGLGNVVLGYIALYDPDRPLGNSMNTGILINRSPVTSIWEALLIMMRIP